MKSPISPKVTHAGAVILKNSPQPLQVLLTRRIGGQVKIPGFFLTQGHIEADETLQAAAKREIIEETGIKNTKLIADLGILTRKGLAEDAQWYRKTIHFFLFQAPNNHQSEWTHHSPDHKTFLLKFVPLKEANSYLYFKEEQDLLKSPIISNLN
jgi:8-oxo-dGTP pyrophosphatase MutT (NUDIX family)